jgi:hypothetical protein
MDDVVDLIQGLESVAKMNKMLDLFKQDIASHASGRSIQIKVIPRLKGLTASQNANEEQTGPTSGTAEGQVTVAQRQHIWVTTMDEFRKSLVNIHGVLRDMAIDMESSRIKVSETSSLKIGSPGLLVYRH